MLTAEGIAGTAAVCRRQQVIDAARRVGLLLGVADTLGIGASLVSIGNAIAGVASRSVMEQSWTRAFLPSEGDSSNANE